MKKISETMTDKELFKEVFDRIAGKNSQVSMSGSLVCYKGQPKFNIDGFNLAYNLYRLTSKLSGNISSPSRMMWR